MMIGCKWCHVANVGLIDVLVGGCHDVVTAACHEVAVDALLVPCVFLEFFLFEFDECVMQVELRKDGGNFCVPRGGWIVQVCIEVTHNDGWECWMLGHCGMYVVDHVCGVCIWG